MKTYSSLDGLGDLEPALVIRRQDVGAGPLDHAERGVHAAADVDAVVAAGAALVDEQPQTLLLLRRKRVRVAPQVTVERRVRRDQGRLEYGDRLLDIVDRERIGVAREGLLEHRHIARNAAQLLDHMLVGGSHLDRVDHRPACLLLEILGPPVPELGGVEYRIETVGALRPPRCQRWPSEVSIMSTPPSPMMWQELQLMLCALRKPRVEVQHLAEFDPVSRGLDPRHGGRCLGNRLEGRLGALEEVFLSAD